MPRKGASPAKRSKEDAQRSTPNFEGRHECLRFTKFPVRSFPDFERCSKNKMPDVDLVNRHPALQSMCSKD
jgi:hypothetical protein